MAAWASARLRTIFAAQRPQCAAEPSARHGTGWHIRGSCQVLPRQLSQNRSRSHAAARHSIAARCQQMERRRDKRTKSDKRRPRADGEVDPQANYVCFDAIGNSAAIHVFGLNHLEVEYAAAEFIWRTKPAVVAVETAFTEAHGARTGAVLTAGEHMQQSPDFRLRMLSQVAAQLDTSQLPENSELWQDLKDQLPGEQLVYVAAFAVGAQLMYADRPKDVTIQRLYNMSSLADLDASFARLSTDNYRELLAKHKGSVYVAAPDTDDCVFRILTAERDAIMAHSLRAVADVEGPANSIVAVVGQSHVPGISQALQQQEQLDRAAVATLNEQGAAPKEQAEVAGAKRALLRAALGLCCSSEVLQEFDRTLGPLPPDQEEHFAVTQEIYGSTRMLLACLPRDELESVCSGCGCDMWEVLAPVRAARPVNGGPGSDMELALDLQMLYLEIGAGAQAAEVAT